VATHIESHTHIHITRSKPKNANNPNKNTPQQHTSSPTPIFIPNTQNQKALTNKTKKFTATHIESNAHIHRRQSLHSTHARLAGLPSKRWRCVSKHRARRNCALLHTIARAQKLRACAFWSCASHGVCLHARGGGWGRTADDLWVRVLALCSS